MEANRAANTLRAYAYAWRQFSKWCAAAGRDPLPASSDTVELFIAQSFERGLRLKTIWAFVTGINEKHRSSSFPPPTGDRIRALMQNAARERKEKPRGKAAITPGQLRRICRRPSDRPIDVRDRAMFLLCFAAGWRGSELVSLERGDICFRKKGVVLSLGASKTDQEGKGRIVGVHRGQCATTCPVKALRHWVDVRGDWAGPLFTRMLPNDRISRQRITRETVNERLKIALERIGVDARAFGSHSLRVGMVTAASEAGYTPQQIKGRTGHKQTKTLEGYIRPAQVFRVDPLAGVL